MIGRILWYLDDSPDPRGVPACDITKGEIAEVSVNRAYPRLGIASALLRRPARSTPACTTPRVDRRPHGVEQQGCRVHHADPLVPRGDQEAGRAVSRRRILKRTWRQLPFWPLRVAPRSPLRESRRAHLG